VLSDGNGLDTTVGDKEGHMAESIREVMTTDPVALSNSATVLDAARAMDEKDIGDVIVLNDANEVGGIVTDRDIVVRVIAAGKDPNSTKLGEICTSEIVSLTPSDSVGQATRLMKEKAIRRLPVVEGGRPVGIVSIGDLAVTHDPESVLADISAAPADE
jgi:signal-transduction protein with cAMP-binding, CBS, and nucleotidyltransferase domain